MKKINTVTDFYFHIGKIANDAGKTYWSVKVQLDTYNTTQYTAYIDGFKWTDDCNTPELVVETMQNMVFPGQAVSHDITL